MDEYSLVGSSVVELVRQLPDLVDRVRTLSFVVYEPQSSLSERLMQTTDTALLERACRIRDLTSEAFPLWEAVLAAAWTSTRFEGWVREAIAHDSKSRRERRFTASASEVAAGRIEDEIKSLNENQALALDSRCVLDQGEAAHLPLMDFKVLPSADAAEKIRLALRAIGQPRGAIVRSGNSYHYYGFEPMSLDEWLAFLSRCLLLSPLTDTRYVAHRLLAGGAALRISAASRKPESPSIVGLI